MNSIKERWDSSNISGIFINNNLQIFDGAHRLMALQKLSEKEFEDIFGSKNVNADSRGVRINIYKDLDSSNLIFYSQSIIQLKL